MSRINWHWRGALVALTVATGALAAAGDELPTVVSTNLCADLVLLSVAAPQQIRAVSPLSHDPHLSPAAATARSYPTSRGSVEALLALKPDIALVYQGWQSTRHSALLASQGIRVIALPYPKNWADAVATTRSVAAQIGRRAAGEQVIAAAERRLHALTPRHSPGCGLYLRPSGGTAGAGTYVDELLTRLGVGNLAAARGYHGWGRFPLEQLVLSPPDLFVLGYFDANQRQANAAYGRHPLLHTLVATTPSITVPTSSWGCGGLELVAAAEHIAAQLESIAADAASAACTPAPRE